MVDITTPLGRPHWDDPTGTVGYLLGQLTPLKLKIWPYFRWVSIILDEWISWVKFFFHDHIDGMCAIWAAIVTSGYTLVFLLHRRSTITIKIYYWLVVWNTFYFPNLWDVILPIDFIFFRGVGQPPTRWQQWKLNGPYSPTPSKLLDYAGATSFLQYRSYSIMTYDILVGGLEPWNFMIFHILGSS